MAATALQGHRNFHTRVCCEQESIQKLTLELGNACASSSRTCCNFCLFLPAIAHFKPWTITQEPSAISIIHDKAFRQHVCPQALVLNVTTLKMYLVVSCDMLADKLSCESSRPPHDNIKLSPWYRLHDPRSVFETKRR